MTLMYDRGSGVAGPSGLFRSKNNTCMGLSDASPAVATTELRRQSGVWPRDVSRHCAPCGSVPIACVTVSGLGASAGPQPCVLVGDGPGGLQPQPMASSPTAVTAASKRSIRMTRAYGHRAAGQKTIVELSGGHRLLAVDALHHRGVPMHQGTDGLAVADGEHVGVPSRLTAGRHLGERDDRVTLGEQVDELHRKRFLGQPTEVLHHFGLAVKRAADRTLARLDPFDVIVEQAHHRLDVTRREGFIALPDELLVLFLGHFRTPF